MALTEKDIATLSSSQQAKIQEYTNMWNEAKAKGDETNKALANALANSVRAEAGYTGGPNGITYGSVDSGTSQEQSMMNSLRSYANESARYNNTGGYTAAMDLYDSLGRMVANNTASAQYQAQMQQQAQQIAALQSQIQQITGQQAPASSSVADLTAYLKQAEQEKLASELASLGSAYQNSMAGYDQQLELLPQTYEYARNATAAQNAQAQTAFDERALASGLSSGARGQAQLSRSANLQNALSQIDQQQANAQSNIDLAKNNLTTNYESTVAQAKADANANLASNMYQELIRQQEQQEQQLAADRAYNMQLANLAQGVGDYSLLNDLGIDTSYAEAQQASLASAYTPTFTRAQVISMAKDAEKSGTSLTGNALRDYNYYFYGDPSYGIGDTSAAIGALLGNGGAATGGKTIDQLAQEVISGKWGNGDARRSALTAAGYDAAAVQARVNSLIGTSPSDTTRTTTTEPATTGSDTFQNPLALGGPNPNYGGYANQRAVADIQAGYDALSASGRSLYTQITGGVGLTTTEKQALLTDAYRNGRITQTEYNFLNAFI